MNGKWIIWDPTPGGNVEHVEAHDLPTDEVEYVLENHESRGVSPSSGLPCAFPDDRYITVVYDEADEDTIVPVTAYEVPEP
jgi:hypothetical protein